MAVTKDTGFPAGAVDTSTNAHDFTWAGFTTPGTNRYLVAIFYGDGGAAKTIATFTSPNLTWTKRLSVLNTGPTRVLEVWTAFAASVVTGEVITQTDTSGASYNRRDFVIYCLNGSDSAGFGASNSNTAGSGDPQNIAITATAAGSLLIAGLFYQSAGGDIAVDGNTTSDYDGGHGGSFGINERAGSRATAAAGSLTLGWAGGETFGGWIIGGIEVVAVASAVSINIPAGSLVATGQVAAPAVDHPVAIPAGSLTMTGLAASALLAFNLTIPAGALAFTGLAPAIANDHAIAIPAGGLVLGGQIAAPMLALNLAIPVGSVALTGLAPSPTITSPNVSISIPVGSLVETGRVAAPVIDHPVAIPVGSLALTGQYVAIEFGGEITVGQLTFTGYAPSPQLGMQIAIPVGSLVYTGRQLAINGQETIAVPVGSLVFTGLAPVVNGTLSIGIPAGSLVMTGLAPIIGWGTGIPAGSLALTGQVLTASQGFQLAIPVGGLVLSGRVVEPDGPRVIAIPAGGLVFTSSILTVTSGGRLGPGDLTTELVKWMRTLPAGDINTQMRDALAALYGTDPAEDLTTLLTRFLRDRTS